MVKSSALKQVVKVLKALQYAVEIDLFGDVGHALLRGQSFFGHINTVDAHLACWWRNKIQDQIDGGGLLAPLAPNGA